MATPAEQARALIQTLHHKEAEQLLRDALAQNPDDPDAQAELGMLLCLTQREFEAVPCWEKAEGAERRTELGTTLASYFYCRSLVAARHSLKDNEAAALSRRVNVPHEDVGITISACLIVKNEEKHLDRCLTSLKGIVDEIVVVDTGSTDATVAIAQRHGAKIGFFEWCDDFSAARNHSLDLASGHWALWIDADEELMPESAACLREAVMRSCFGGYFFQICNQLDANNPAVQYMHSAVRLFRRIPGVRFEGRVHEQLLQCFDRLKLPSANLGQGRITHYGYQQQDMLAKGKVDRTVSLLLAELEASPEDGFQWFNLANVYSVDRRFDESIEAARKALKFSGTRAPYVTTAFQILSSGLLMQGKWDEAIEVCEEARERGTFTIINQFDLAHALMRADRLTEALEAIDTCAEMPWPPELAGDYGIKTYKTDVLKAQALVKLGRPEEALALTERALTFDPNLGYTHWARARAFELLERWADAARHFELAARMQGMEDCRILAAQNYERAGEGDQAISCWQAAWERAPERTDLAAALASAVESTGKVQLMLDTYQTLASSGFGGAALALNWGRALVSLGDLDGGCQKMREARDLAPEDCNVRFNLGDALYQAGQFGEAADEYEAGLRLQPDHAEAWFMLGNCFARLESSEGARLAYRQTLALAPGHAGAEHNLNVLSAAA